MAWNLKLLAMNILLREHYSKKHYLRVLKLYKFLSYFKNQMLCNNILNNFISWTFGGKKKKNLFQKFKHYQLQWMTVHSCFLSPLGTRFSGGHAITLRLASKFCWGCCDLLAGMTQMKPPFKKMTQCYLKDSVM